MKSSNQSASVEDRIQVIVSTIRAEEQRLRNKYAILQFQDMIGLGIMLVSLAGMIASGWLYFADLSTRCFKNNAKYNTGASRDAPAFYFTEPGRQVLQKHYKVQYRSVT